ncbi:hypothetical protein [Actinoallomurus sp. NPDC050550]|uniref:hypothetical protein n=1 Tax=Actinoallomurus sp. NPDC050550 TaxID=3154937 RepID=UPI0034044167
MTERGWRTALLVFGVSFVAQAAWATIDASSFAGTIADFGPRNDHLVHDYAACSATFGAGMLVAVERRRWRTPTLTLAALWNGFHTVSHVVDICAARPAVLGPLEAGALVIVSAALAILARLSSSKTS